MYFFLLGKWHHDVSTLSSPHHTCFYDNHETKPFRVKDGGDMVSFALFIVWLSFFQLTPRYLS